MGKGRVGRSDGALDWPTQSAGDDRGSAGDYQLEWKTPDDPIRPANNVRRPTGPAAAGRTPVPGPEGDEVAVLRSLVAELQAAIAELRRENAVMRRQLGERPPSSARVGRGRGILVSRRS